MLGNGSELNIHYPPQLPSGLENADDSVVESEIGSQGGGHGNLGAGL